MNEMVERVALAISGSDDPANILEIHRQRARAAIKAMREPTLDMIMAAGYLYMDKDKIPIFMESHDWPLMIDGALK